MAEDKKGIIVYADWIDKFEELEDDEAGRLIKHFFRYVNDLDPVAPDRTTKLMFIDIQNQLKRDLKKWETTIEDRSTNGRLGNLKRWNLDLYNKIILEELTLDEAENIAKHRKASLPDKNVSPHIANIAVNDNVTVNVNDTVNVTVKDINTQKENLVFAEKKSELIKLVCEKYGYTENRHFARKRIVMAYFDVNVKSDEDYDYFVKNFNSYIDYKISADEKQHGFDGLFGTQAKRFEDGALNNENWEQKLNNFHSLNKKKTKSENIADVFGEALNNLKNGHSTL